MASNQVARDCIDWRAAGERRRTRAYGATNRPTAQNAGASSVKWRTATNRELGTQFPIHTPPSTQLTMSYAGPVRTRNAQRLASARNLAPDSRPETDWQQVAIFGAGLALGIALGAGVALLTAPQAGEETRADLGRRARRTSRVLGRRSHHAWQDLRDELRGMTRALSRRNARRPAERELARESAAD